MRFCAHTRFCKAIISMRLLPDRIQKKEMLQEIVSTANRLFVSETAEGDKKVSIVSPPETRPCT